MGTVKVLAIDLYGTLLDTSSITAVLNQYVNPSSAPKIAQDWRKYQLEYTWRLNSMDQYEPFGTVTRLSLLHALQENSTPLPTEAVAALLVAYAYLKPFADVAAFISELSSLSSTRALIFSNGAPLALTTTLSKSSLQGLRDMKYVSVDAVKRYKPDPRTYEYLVQTQQAELGSLDPSEVCLVSSNPFDIVGAAQAGLGTVWVDREGAGWADRLGRPEHVVRSLEEVIRTIKEGVNVRKSDIENDPTIGKKFDVDPSVGVTIGFHADST